MLSRSNIDDILTATRGEYGDITEKDVMFLLLTDGTNDLMLAYDTIYNEELSEREVKDFLESGRMEALAKVMRNFGVCKDSSIIITGKENQEELAKMIPAIEAGIKDKSIESAVGLKMIYDIRFKLHDKFDMEKGDNANNNLLMLPKKHDIICSYAHRECTRMPTMEACMEYYDLVPRKKKKG